MCSDISLKATMNAELIGFICSVTLHSILLWLIWERPRIQFGNYKYLMMSFSALGIFYSSCNFWSKPNVHITKTSFIVFTILKDSGFSKFFGSIAVTIYCSCYAMMLSLLFIQFFYRYTSVTSPMSLATRFSLKSVPIWILFVSIYSSIWGLSSYFLCGPSENKDLELKEEFRNFYCLPETEYAYVGPQYYYYQGSQRHFHLQSFLGIAILGLQLSIVFLSVIYFGYCTYRTLYKLGSRAYASRELQKQLFRTLVIQSLIPFIFMYVPVTLMFLLPMFGVKIQASWIPISVAIYPCFEPLVAMIFIKDIRKRISGFLICCPKRRFQVESYTISSAAMNRAE